MRYALDTEFIDTPTCSALISLALVAEDGGQRYFEFEYPKAELTPWLDANVVPNLTGRITTFAAAAREITGFVDRSPEFWCHFGAYDWYWLCRVFGGFLNMPQDWPHAFKEYCWIEKSIPTIGNEHNALDDCRSLMQALTRRAA